MTQSSDGCFDDGIPANAPVLSEDGLAGFHQLKTPPAVLISNRKHVKYDIRAILTKGEWAMPDMMTKYDTSVGLRTPLDGLEFGKLKRVLSEWLLRHCKTQGKPDRQAELVPFCQAIVEAFPKQRLDLTDLITGRAGQYSGAMEVCIRNMKTNRKGFAKRPYRKQEAAYLSGLDSKTLDSVNQKMAFLRTTKPTAANMGELLQMHIDTMKARREMLKDPKASTFAVQKFPRFLDIPEFMIEDFKYDMMKMGENIDVDGFAASWENDWVPAILNHAIAKKPTCLIRWRSEHNLNLIVGATTLEQLPFGLRSELAFMVLPFIIPACNRFKCGEGIMDQLMIVLKDQSPDQVAKYVAERETPFKQPIIVKLVRGVEETFFLAFDRSVFQTGGTMTKAILLLLCAFQVFWLNFPVSVKPVFKLIGHVLGARKDFTATLKSFIKQLFEDVISDEYGGE